MPPSRPSPVFASAPLCLAVRRVPTLKAAEGPRRRRPSRRPPQTTAGANGARRAASRRGRACATRAAATAVGGAQRSHVTSARCRRAAVARPQRCGGKGVADGVRARPCCGAAASPPPCPDTGPQRPSNRPTTVSRCGWKMRSAVLVGSLANPIRCGCTAQDGGVGPPPAAAQAGATSKVPHLHCWIRPRCREPCGSPWQRFVVVHGHARPPEGPVGRPLVHATPFKYHCCGCRAFSWRNEYPTASAPTVPPRVVSRRGDPTRRHRCASTDSVVGGGARCPTLAGFAARGPLTFAAAPVHRHGDGGTAVCAARCSRQPTTRSPRGAASPPPPHVTGWRTGAPLLEAATAGGGPARAPTA